MEIGRKTEREMENWAAAGPGLGLVWSGRVMRCDAAHSLTHPLTPTRSLAAHSLAACLAAGWPAGWLACLGKSRLRLRRCAVLCVCACARSCLRSAEYGVREYGVGNSGLVEFPTEAAMAFPSIWW